MVGFFLVGELLWGGSVTSWATPSSLDQSNKSVKTDKIRISSLSNHAARVENMPNFLLTI